MRLIVDANILVAELLRKRGRLLFKDKRTELFKLIHTDFARF